MRARLGRGDWALLAGLVLFALFFRLATLMMIHTGVDERDYWNSAKAIARGLPYPELSHRTNRFAVILPTALAQALLGSGPNVYYVTPILNAMVQAGLAFLVGLRLRGRLAGFLAATFLILFPYMIRAGSQVRPEIFSITYMLLVLLFFVDYMSRKEGDLPPLLWSALCLFLAYETKITNLFFLPGLLVAILAYKRSLRQAFLFGGLLLLLYLAETGAYAALTEYKLGMLQVITQKHFSADKPFVLERFVDLFGRYSAKKLQAYWQLPFALFLVASLAYLIRGKDRRVSSVAIAGFSFFLCITFEVKTFDPITPAEPFINRYFCAALVPVALVLACAAAGLLRRPWVGARPRAILDSSRAYLALLGLAAIGCLAVASLPGLPAGLRQYLNDPLRPERHPLALNEAYRREIDAAYGGGRPIVAAAGLGGANAILTCASYYLGPERYVDGRLPGFAERELDGSRYNVLAAPGASAEASGYLAAVRAPFRVAPLARAALPGLTADSFAGKAAGRGSDADEEEE